MSHVVLKVGSFAASIYVAFTQHAVYGTRAHGHALSPGAVRSSQGKRAALSVVLGCAFMRTTEALR